MEKETKIIAKWILYAILLTATFILIFFYLSWIVPKINGSDGVEVLFVMMLVFYWCFGIIVGFKFCDDEPEKLENEEQLEIKKEISPKEETEIKK